jgi:hypothetical protein
MKLKGRMVLELTDVNTSEVETIVEENMVTNAVNNILGTNPMGFFMRQRRSMTVRFCGMEICCQSAQI